MERLIMFRQNLFFFRLMSWKTSLQVLWQTKLTALIQTQDRMDGVPHVRWDIIYKDISDRYADNMVDAINHI